MRLEKYLKMYGTEYIEELRIMGSVGNVLICGMIQFNNETAHLWRDPYPGGFAYYSVENHTKDPNLQNIDINDRNAMGYPTIEYPYRIYVTGKDDTSYSLCYASYDAVMAALLYLLESQPVDFNDDFIPMGFVFTY